MASKVPCVTLGLHLQAQEMLGTVRLYSQPIWKTECVEASRGQRTRNLNRMVQSNTLHSEGYASQSGSRVSSGRTGHLQEIGVLSFGTRAADSVQPSEEGAVQSRSARQVQELDSKAHRGRPGEGCWKVLALGRNAGPWLS